MPTTILSLPPETIYEIGLQLDTNDNRSLSLVSQYISCSVEALVLAKLFIDINTVSFEKTYHQLSSIASQPTRIVKHARDVIIYNSYYGVSTGLDEENRFTVLFPTVMSLLSNVRSLSWYTCPGDSKSSVEAIMDQIGLNPRIEASFDCSGGCSAFFPAQLGLIGGRHSLRLTNIFLTGHHAAAVASAVEKVVSQSPAMTYLDIDSGYYAATVAAPSLHDILPKDTTIPPLPLESLRLRCMRTLLDAETLYHLRSLKSLSIHFNLTTSTHGSHLFQIWETLKNESIYLTKIDVNLTEVDDSLLDYLVSYDGIEQIIFDNSARLWSHSDESVANRFFDEVLPKVARTLKVLNLVTISLGAWCFGRHNAGAISQCKHLEELTVSIVDIVQNHSKGTLDLLAQTVAQLPKLQILDKKNVSFVPQIGYLRDFVREP